MARSEGCEVGARLREIIWWQYESIEDIFFFFFNFFLAISLCLGGYTYVTVLNLPARRQPHSVFGAFVHGGTICLFLDP